MDMKATDIANLDSHTKKYISRIDDPNTDVISFDIFDTLIVQPFLEPNALFQFMNGCPEIREIMNGQLFSDCRLAAKKSIVLKNKNTEKPEEVTLNEIYNELSIISGISLKDAEAIKDRQIHFEIQFSNAQESVKRLYDHAEKSKKTLILCADTDLSSKTIKRILEKCGYNHPDHILVSCEHNASKSNGDLFQKTSQQLGVKPDRILHFGNNSHADILNARQAGWKAIHLVAPKDRFFLQKNNPFGSYYPKYISAKDIPEASISINYALNANYHFGRYLSEQPQRGTAATDFGYHIFGPFLLSLTLWMRRLCKQKNIDFLAFLARDGYLPLEASKIIDKITGPIVRYEYLPISRRALQSFYFLQYKSLDHIKSWEFSKHLTVKDLMHQRFGDTAVKLLKERLADSAEYVFSCYARDHINEILNLLEPDYQQIRDTHSESHKHLEEYYKNFFPTNGNSAIFDVGPGGSCHAALSHITGLSLHGFYVINSHRIFSNVSDSSFDSYLGLIDPQLNPLNYNNEIYEVLLSSKDGSCMGFDNNNPILQKPSYSQEELQLFEQLHTAALAYVQDAVSLFRERVTELEQNSYYAVYGLENHHRNKDFRKLLTQITHSDVLGDSKKMHFQDKKNPLQTFIARVSYNVKRSLEKRKLPKVLNSCLRDGK